jgi:hypothetical protein
MFGSRRDFLLASTGVLACLSPGRAAETWMEKKPAEWDADDIQTILSRSGWARVTNPELTPASLRSGQKKGKRVAAAEGLRDKRTLTDFKVLICWESGLPVRLARRNNAPATETAPHYVLSMSRMPIAFMSALVGGGKAGKEGADKQEIASQILKSSSLQREGKNPIPADRAEWVEGAFEPRVVISFPQDRQIIEFSDRTVTFTTQIGTLVIRALFPLKDMFYRGNLEL